MGTRGPCPPPLSLVWVVSVNVCFLSLQQGRGLARTATGTHTGTPMKKECRGNAPSPIFPCRLRLGVSVFSHFLCVFLYTGHFLYCILGTGLARTFKCPAAVQTVGPQYMLWGACRIRAMRMVAVCCTDNPRREGMAHARDRERE